MTKLTSGSYHSPCHRGVSLQSGTVSDNWRVTHCKETHPQLVPSSNHIIYTLLSTFTKKINAWRADRSSLILDCKHDIHALWSACLLGVVLIVCLISVKLTHNNALEL